MTCVFLEHLKQDSSFSFFLQWNFLIYCYEVYNVKNIGLGILLGADANTLATEPVMNQTG